MSDDCGCRIMGEHPFPTLLVGLAIVALFCLPMFFRMARSAWRRGREKRQLARQAAQEKVIREAALKSYRGSVPTTE